MFEATERAAACKREGLTSKPWPGSGGHPPPGSAVKRAGNIKSRGWKPGLPTPSGGAGPLRGSRRPRRWGGGAGAGGRKGKRKGRPENEKGIVAIS